MSLALVLLVPFALLAVVALVVLLALAATARPDAEIGAGAAAARRHAVRGGVLAVVVAAAVVLTLGAVAGRVLEGVAEGQVLAVLLLVGATAHTLVLALTELTWPRPRGHRRSGLLVRRRLADVLPRAALVLTAVLAALVVAVALVGAVVADGSGRALTRASADGTATWSAGPFPGAPYAVPVLLALLVLLALAAATARLVLARPAVSGADAATDAALRRASAHRVLRGTAAGCALTLGGLLAVSSSAVRGVADGSAGLVALAVLLAVAAALAVLTGVLLPAVPAPRVPARAADPVGLAA